MFPPEERRGLGTSEVRGTDVAGAALCPGRRGGEVLGERQEDPSSEVKITKLPSQSS